MLITVWKVMVGTDTKAVCYSEDEARDMLHYYKGGRIVLSSRSTTNFGGGNRWKRY